MNTSHIGEHLTVSITKAPLCHVVVSDTKERICGCMQSAVKILDAITEKGLPEEQRDYLMTKKIASLQGKIKINTCRRGEITLCITRTDGSTITPEWINTHQKELYTLITNILNETDERHIMYETRDKALVFDPEQNGYVMTLHRGIPKKIAAKEFPHIAELF